MTHATSTSGPDGPDNTCRGLVPSHRCTEGLSLRADTCYQSAVTHERPFAACLCVRERTREVRKQKAREGLIKTQTGSKSRLGRVRVKANVFVKR